MIGTIRAITFDLWQTLLLEDAEVNRRRAQLRIDRVNTVLQATTHPFKEKELWQAFRECVAACGRIRSQGRETSFDGQIDIFLEQLEPGLSDALSRDEKKAVREAYDLAFLESPLPPDPAAAPMLEALKRRGCSLGLISNTAMTSGATFRVYLERLGLFQYFDALIFSDEIGWAKPSGTVFRQALDALGVPSRRGGARGRRPGRRRGRRTQGRPPCRLGCPPPESYDEPYAYQPPTDDEPHATVTVLDEVIPALERLAHQ